MSSIGMSSISLEWTLARFFTIFIALSTLDLPMKTTIIFFCAALLAFPGCIRTIAVSTVGGIADDGFEAFTSEKDLDFAEQALPGNLKLLEVMLKSDPDNVRLLRLLSQGY